MIHNCPATSVLLFWNFPDIIVQIISRKCQGYQSSRSFSLSTSWYHYISRARGTLLLSFSIRKVYRIYLFRWSVFHDGYTVAQHSKWFWTKDNNETFHHSRPICVDLLSVHWMSHLVFFLFSFWMLHDVVISSSWRSSSYGHGLHTHIPHLYVMVCRFSHVLVQRQPWPSAFCVTMTLDLISLGAMVLKKRVPLEKPQLYEYD